MDDSTVPLRREDPEPADVDRLETLEQQVRQLTSRLAGWVEAQLVQAMDDRRNDLKALRSELQAVVAEQLAGMRVETASVVNVAARRLEVAQEQLGERVDAIGDRAAEAGATATAVGAASFVDGSRLELLEQRLDERLAEAADRHRAELQVLRADLESVVAEGVQAAMARAPAAEALELRIRQAMSRLTESVEGQLAELRAGRGTEVEAVRAEMGVVLEEGLRDVASRSAAGVAAVQDRLSQQSAALTERMDAIARQAATAADVGVAAGSGAEAGTARLDAFEQRVKAAMGRLTESVEARLEESSRAKQADVERLRSELSQRVDVVTLEAARVGEGLVAMEAASRVGSERTESLEQQVKAAMARQAEVVEAQLGQLALTRDAADEARRAELRAAMAQQGDELRAELAAGAQSFRSGIGRVHARLDALEAGGGSGALGPELDTAVAEKLREARSEIGVALDAAHRRFALAQEEIEGKVEALEQHTRRTDDKLTELVEEKIAALRGDQGAQLDRFGTELQAAVANQVGTSLVDARRELAAGTAALDAQRAEIEALLAGRADDVRSALAAGAAQLVRERADLQAELAAGLARIDQREAALLEQTAEAATLVEAQADVAAALAALGRRMDRAQDRTRKRFEAVSGQLQDLAISMEKAAAGESVALAPLRSDMRLLQGQMVELGEAVAALGPGQKAAAKKEVPVNRAAVVARAPARPARPRRTPRAGAEPPVNQ